MLSDISTTRTNSTYFESHRFKMRYMMYIIDSWRWHYTWARLLSMTEQGRSQWEKTLHIYIYICNIFSHWLGRCSAIERNGPRCCYDIDDNDSNVSWWLHFCANVIHCDIFYNTSHLFRATHNIIREIQHLLLYLVRWTVVIIHRH